MELYENENENRDYLFSKLNGNPELTSKNYLMGKEISVPYKQIYIPVRKSLEIWCFKQDICVYHKLFDESIDGNNIFLNSEGKNIIKVILERNGGKGDVGMPFLIMETKMANADTHSLLAASEKIKMIKTIFPYCKAFLLIFGSPLPRAFRHCLDFDEISYIVDLNDESCNGIIKKIIYWTIVASSYLPYIAESKHNYI